MVCFPPTGNPGVEILLETVNWQWAGPHRPKQKLKLTRNTHFKVEKMAVANFKRNKYLNLAFFLNLCKNKVYLWFSTVKKMHTALLKQLKINRILSVMQERHHSARYIFQQEFSKSSEAEVSLRQYPEGSACWFRLHLWTLRTSPPPAWAPHLQSSPDASSCSHNPVDGPLVSSGDAEVKPEYIIIIIINRPRSYKR